MNPCINVTEQELTEVIEEVTRDAEEDKSTLKKDAVFAKLNFTLDSGSFKLLGVKTEQQTGTDNLPHAINKYCDILVRSSDV